MVYTERKIFIMKLRKTALLLAVIITAITIMSALPTAKVGAATSAEVQYFLDTVGPMCTNDMRDNHILASFSMAQAIWESGWGTSTLAKEANALFGIRAYSGWSGKIYDRSEKKLYDNWAAVKAAKGEAYVKNNTLVFWRAYDSWQESVNDHSNLFNTMSIYENLRGNYDYKSCCDLVVKDGYCGDPSYTTVLIQMIEQQNLERFNYNFGNGGGTTPPVDTSVSLSPSALYMDKGALYTLSASVSGGEYTLTSSNSSVALVTGNSVKAVADGSAVITLTAGGKSARCTVTVKSGYGGIVADGVYVKCLAVGGTASIPTEAKTISKDAFKGSSVTTIVVGNSVSSIEAGAFDGTGAGLTLFGYGNSVVQDYASKNAISYVNVAGWVVDKSVSILSGVQAYTTAAVIDTYYKLNGVTATVKGANGAALLSTAYVGTGCTVTVSGVTYTVTVKGDTDGDGKTSTADLITLKTYLTGEDEALPDRAYRRAADFNGDNRITTADYLAIFNEK